MTKNARPAFAGLVAIAALLAIAIGTSSAAGKAHPAAAPVVNMVEGTFPQSLDPGLDYTTQGSEINWIVYTGLLTYAHKNGPAGSVLIPGLATSLPKISDGGKTYTLTLRKGLVFSNGQSVVASDFPYTVERALKIPWGGAGAFITPYIKGAAAYGSGKASSISGISTNDATGQIVIHLTQAYGPFTNVLAFPSLGIIPKGTPMTAQPTSPPPGVGPYKVTNIVANSSYTVEQNPYWSKMNIPGIPAGHVTVNVKANANVSANALAVLNGSADIFDWADNIPGSLLSQIQSKAKGHFRYVDLGGSTYYIFMNSQEPPFNNQLAREAVVTAINQPAMSRLGSGTLVPACYFLPPAIAGHPNLPDSSCPYGNPTKGGNIAKAKQLVQQSGEKGAQVTVWSEQRVPRQQWMTYYTQVLNEIGFKATQKLLSDSTYFTTIGESKKLHPQTGFADWNQDFPNPVDFYGPLLDGNSIQPVNNENFGETNDPYINKMVKQLGTVPSTKLSTVAAKWAKLDEYVAKKAYAGVFGYEQFPEYTSSRINYGALVFEPIYGWDLTSFQLK